MGSIGGPILSVLLERITHPRTKTPMNIIPPIERDDSFCPMNFPLMDIFDQILKHALTNCPYDNCTRGIDDIITLDFTSCFLH